jgi:uncharacterized membrane protein YebE (DUF533 family)
MHGERRRLFDRIQQLGRDEPETYGWLAKEFASPAQLLGGDDAAGIEATLDRLKDVDLPGWGGN